MAAVSHMALLAAIAPASGPVVVTHNGNANGTVSGGVVSLAAVPFGAAAGNRIIALSVMSEVNVTAVTIGGITATKAVGGGVDVFASIWYAVVPTGTSGTVVLSAVSDGVCVSCFSVNGAGSPTPSDTDSYATTAAQATLSSMTVPSNGGAIFAFTNESQATAVTWTGATEVQDVALGGVRASAAYTQTVGTNSIIADGGTDSQALVGASWGP